MSITDIPCSVDAVASKHRPPLDMIAAAAYLGTSKVHVKRLTGDGRLPHVRVGGLIRFLPDDLDAWLEANRYPKPVSGDGV